jgi:hypothetical protein
VVPDGLLERRRLNRGWMRWFRLRPSTIASLWTRLLRLLAALRAALQAAGVGAGRARLGVQARTLPFVQPA